MQSFSDIDQELYKQVVKIIEYQSGAKKIKPESRIAHDMGVDGDDADELINALQKQFDIDMTNFSFDKHFGPEGFNPISFIYFLFNRNKLNLIPITVMDLYIAAKTKKFPDLSERLAE